MPPKELEPPVNYEAEQALLGAILAENLAYEEVADILRPEHFAEQTHGEIYQACGQLIDAGKAANAVTLKKMFDQHKALEAVGGSRYLVELQGNYISAANAKDYAETLIDLWKRRLIVSWAEGACLDVQEDYEASAAQIGEVLESGLQEVLHGADTTRNTVSLSDATIAAVDQLRAGWESGNDLIGISTGLEALDQLTNGLEAPDLIVLAARPSMGKTAMITNMSVKMAEQGTKVLGFSLEMSQAQITMRMLAERAGLSFQHMRSGDTSQDERDRVEEEGVKLSNLPVFIDDTPRLSVAQMAAKARRIKRKHGLDLVWIDLLGHISPPDKGAPRYQQIGDTTKALKGMAKALGVPVIVLHHLNRSGLDQDGHRPKIEHLRESGDVEQDVDAAWLLHREAYYLEREKPSQRKTESDDAFKIRCAEHDMNLHRVRNDMEVIVPKQRNGPAGVVRLYFDGRLMRVRDRE